MNTKPVVVVGDGWAALGTVGFLVSSGVVVKWISGTGARIAAPVACMEWSPGVAVIANLASKLNVACGEARQGSFVREFRNKSFREPLWIKAPTPELRVEARDELLWSPEQRFVGAFDSRFEFMCLNEIEEAIRKVLVPENYPHLTKIVENPVKGIRLSTQSGASHVEAVILGSGEEVLCDRVIYADRWAALPGIEGIPKPLPFLRGTEPMGVFQASFVHQTPIAAEILESFFAPLPKEAGEKVDRHFWGYFSTDGMQSHWTFCLSSEEVENNHEIAKKLKKMKSSLERIFTGSGFLPSEEVTFSSTIVEEQVRLIEEWIFSEGSYSPEKGVPQKAGIQFLTDGYGISCAFQQVSQVLELKFDSPEESTSSHTQTEGVDATDSSSS